MSEDKIKSLVFGELFQCQQKINSGSFGTVYEGLNVKTKEPVAIKIEITSPDKKRNTLQKESAFLSKLKGIKGIPELKWFGIEHEYYVLVLPILGLDLARYVKKKGPLEIMRVIDIAEQLLFTIKDIHEKGILHRDIKPENVLFERNPETNIVYLVDFGISKYYVEFDGKIIPKVINKPFVGTLRYASVSSHYGIELSRKGSLPWQNLNVPNKDKQRVVGKLKKEATRDYLCRDLPNKFGEIFEYIRSIKYEDIPNYSKIQAWIEEMQDTIDNENKTLFKSLQQSKTVVAKEDNDGKDLCRFNTVNVRVKTSKSNTLMPPIISEGRKNSLASINSQIIQSENCSLYNNCGSVVFMPNSETNIENGKKG